MDRTGASELYIKDIVEKLGSMADTTKCCATGTCDNYQCFNAEAPQITSRQDPVNAQRLADIHGYLV